MPGALLDRAAAQQLTRDLTASAKKPVTILAPFTGEPLHDLPQSTTTDVEAAAAAARAAQQEWWAAGFAHRKKVLLRAHDLLVGRREKLLDAVQSETGKTRGQAFEEVFQAASATRYAALSAKKVLGPQRRRAQAPATYGDGAIVLLHSWPDVTASSLPRILDELIAEETEFVTLDAIDPESVPVAALAQSLPVRSLPGAYLCHMLGRRLLVLAANADAVLDAAARHAHRARQGRHGER